MTESRKVSSQLSSGLPEDGIGQRKKCRKPIERMDHAIVAGDACTLNGNI